MPTRPAGKVMKWAFLSIYCLTFGSRVITSLHSLVYPEPIAYAQLSLAVPSPNFAGVDWTVSFGFRDALGTNGTQESGRFALPTGRLGGPDLTACLIDQNSKLTLLTPETQGWDGWTQPISKDAFAGKMRDPDFLESVDRMGCRFVVGLVNVLRRPTSGQTVMRSYNVSRRTFKTQILPEEEPLYNPRKWVSLALSPALAIIDIPIFFAFAIGMLFRMH